MKSEALKRVEELSILYDLEQHTLEERVTASPENRKILESTRRYGGSARYTESQKELIELFLHDDTLRDIVLKSLSNHK